MRIIFMGTPEFAVPSLDILIQSGYEVVAVVTATDKYGGRGNKILLESAVKKYALAKKIPILQPKNLKNQEFIDKLKSFKADIQIVVAFRMLPEVVWNMPNLGTYNVHGSLLPKFRGAAPINWAIIQGEEETGLTTFKLKHEIDTGNILRQIRLPIHTHDTAGTLHNKMMHLSASVLLESIQDIESNNLNLKPQDAMLVSKAPKIHHNDCKIDFNQPATDVYNFIRGMSPYPTAWLTIKDKKLKVFKCSFSQQITNSKPGELITDGKSNLSVATTDGKIDLLEIQLEGKKKMDIKAFLNGYSQLVEN